MRNNQSIVIRCECLTIVVPSPVCVPDNHDSPSVATAVEVVDDDPVDEPQVTSFARGMLAANAVMARARVATILVKNMVQ